MRSPSPENENPLVNGTLRVHHIVPRQLWLLWPPTILLTAAGSYLPNELRSSLSFGQSEFSRNTTWGWPNPIHLRHLFRVPFQGPWRQHSIRARASLRLWDIGA